MRPLIWHNPACGTSRNVLHVLERTGLAPQVVLYLQTPPDRASLQQAIADAGMNVRDAMRRKGTPFEALGLDDPSLDDDALIDAMLAEPILINRPFVRTAGGVALCRPAERVFDLIDVSPPAGLTRTDARPLTPDTPVRADDPALAEALAGAGLPIEDLAQTSARFFSYAEPGGRSSAMPLSSRWARTPWSVPLSCCRKRAHAATPGPSCRCCCAAPSMPARAMHGC